MKPKVILLAAGRGKRFGKRTSLLPKCLIPIGDSGENLLQRYLRSFKEVGISEVVIVVGHLKEKIKKECRAVNHDLNIKFITNPQYKLGSIVSLFTAYDELNSNILIMDADVYFPTSVLKKLINSKKKSAFLIDPRSKSSGEEMMLMRRTSKPIAIAKKINPSLKVLGEATGILKLETKHALLLREILKDFVLHGNKSVEYEEAYTVLMGQSTLGYEAVGNIFWSEMDFEEDLKKILSGARDFSYSNIKTPNHKPYPHPN